MRRCAAHTDEIKNVIQKILFILLLLFKKIHIIIYNFLKKVCYYIIFELRVLIYIYAMFRGGMFTFCDPFLYLGLCLPDANYPWGSKACT